MRFERKPQDFQYGKTPLSLAFLAFCMGSFEVRVTILNQGDSYQRTLSVFKNYKHHGPMYDGSK